MKRKILSVFALAVVLTSALVVGSSVASGSRAGVTLGGTVVFTKGTQVLGTANMQPGEGLDVRWKASTCQKGFDSPPVVAQWDGLARGTFAQPLFAPCHVKHAVVRRDFLDSFSWYCYWDNDGNFHCGWDWVSSSALSEVTNSLKATSAGVGLSKGHITGATEVMNGKRTSIKVNVPAGTTAVHWVGASSGTP